MATHEEFSTAKSKTKKYLRDLSRKPEKVGIIATLIRNPSYSDEPFANLDPTTIPIKKNHQGFSRQSEVTVLVSSHDLQHTVEVSDRIVAMHKGEVVKDIQTSPETLKN
jgi:ABC-2 type transport system ATP-binding protein